MQMQAMNNWYDEDPNVPMFEPTQIAESSGYEYMWAIRAGIWGVLEPFDKVSPVIHLKSMSYHVGRLPHCPNGVDDCIVIDNPTVSKSLSQRRLRPFDMQSFVSLTLTNFY
jgi:hypothetical protein